MRIEQGKLKLASIQNSCSVSKIQCWTFQGVLELCPDTSSIASRVRSSIAGAINHWQLIILWWLLSRWRYFRNKTVIQECYLVISQQTKCSPSFGVRPHRLIFFLVSHLLPLQCMIYIQYVCYLYIICILYLYYIHIIIVQSFIQGWCSHRLSGLWCGLRWCRPTGGGKTNN